jgi:hypothetical protein
MRILVAFGPSCPTTVPKNDAAISDPMRQYCCRLRSMLLSTKIQDVRTDDDGVYVLLNFGRCCSGGIFFWSRGVGTTDDAILVVSFFLFQRYLLYFSSSIFGCTHS